MKEEGIVFDIQRFSIHDGPGIRTLVFLKGCDLRCPWCSNPESQRFEADLFFHTEKCIGCQKCLNVCPHGAITVADGRLSFMRHFCENCGECSAVCYAEARVIKGHRMDTEKVLEEILKDEVFYANSGGGVTLGGGEPLAQADFAMTILKRCKENGLHTAVETAGHIPWPQVEKVLPYADLILYDVKHMDPERHCETIGVDNRLILANLERLLKKKKRVIIRTPLIPGFNDADDQVGAIACYGASLGVKEINLLPYHRFGEGKYRLLGRHYQLLGEMKLDKEKVDELANLVVKIGLKVKVGG
jgi:pyruvate formate lyase activating enzyme